MKTFDINKEDLSKAKELADRILTLGTGGIRKLNPHLTGTQLQYLRVKGHKIARYHNCKNALVIDCYRQLLSYIKTHKIEHL